MKKRDNTYNEAAKVEFDSYAGLSEAYLKLKADNEALKADNENWKGVHKFLSQQFEDAKADSVKWYMAYQECLEALKKVSEELPEKPKLPITHIIKGAVDPIVKKYSQTEINNQ